MPRVKCEKNGRLTLEQIVEEVSVIADLPPEDAKRAVYAIFWSMIQALRRGEAVRLKELGNFEVVMRAPFRGWDPAYGGIREIPAKKVVKFSEHKVVRYLLNPHEFYPEEHFG